MSNLQYFKCFHTVRCLLFCFLFSFSCLLRKNACSGRLASKFWNGCLLGFGLGLVDMNWMDRLGGRVPSSTMLGKILAGSSWLEWVSSIFSKSEKVLIPARLWLGMLHLKVFSTAHSICLIFKKCHILYIYTPYTLFSYPSFEISAAKTNILPSRMV